MADERTGIPVSGWSDRVNDPDVLAGLAKVRRAGCVFAVVVLILAFFAPVVAAMFSDKLKMDDAVKIGAAIAVAIALCSLISKIAYAFKKPYEATVIAKKESEKKQHDDKNDKSRHEYITIVRLPNGKTKKIVETLTLKHSAWKYLKVGDRFRYHPHLNYPYELYDKAAAGCLFCGVCSMENPVEADRCKKCGAPLIK